MPEHSALDTDAVPGTNLVDLQPGETDAGDDEGTPPNPFEGPNTRTLSIALITTVLFLTAFLIASFLSARRKEREIPPMFNREISL